MRHLNPRCTVKRAVGWDYRGFTLDGQKYWVGVFFSKPEKLWFNTRCRINPEATTKLGIGELKPASWVPGGFRWWYGINLDAEPVRFFARSKVSQMEWMEAFLRDCLAKARSIETPDQSPIPDVPEEGN